MPAAVAIELGISLSRYYQLRTEYLAACAQGRAETWSPCLSGGAHHPAWSPEVLALLKKLLASKPPSSYSACASELHRRLDFKTDRASVRRWAIQNQLAPDTRHKAAPKPLKPKAKSNAAMTTGKNASHHFWPLITSSNSKPPTACSTNS